MNLCTSATAAWFTSALPRVGLDRMRSGSCAAMTCTSGVAGARGEQSCCASNPQSTVVSAPALGGSSHPKCLPHTHAHMPGATPPPPPPGAALLAHRHEQLRHLVQGLASQLRRRLRAAIIRVAGALLHRCLLLVGVAARRLACLALRGRHRSTTLSLRARPSRGAGGGRFACTTSAKTNACSVVNAGTHA